LIDAKGNYQGIGISSYHPSGRYTFDMKCPIASRSSVVPIIWDSVTNTIGVLSYSGDGNIVCNGSNKEVSSDPYNIITVFIPNVAGTTTLTQLLNNFIYTVTVDKRVNFIRIDKSNLNHTEQISTDLASISSMILFNGKALLLNAERDYTQINLKKMIVEDSGELTLAPKDASRSFILGDILHMITQEGTIARYAFEPINKKSVDKATRIIIGSIISVAGVCIVGLFIIILCFIRSSYTRTKKQKDIEMRLLETEVPHDPNSTQDFMRKSVIIPIQDLKFGSRISEGANGVVYKGFWKRTDVAIKRIKATDNIEGFIKECSILNHLRHMNVVLFLGMSQDDAENRYIVTEFVENGSLDTLIHNPKLQLNQILSFSQKIRILKHVCQGMIYLHSMIPPIIHRDLKPQNILLTKNLDAKICDFGVSKYCDSDYMTGVQYGTLEYVAPEILSIEYDDDSAVYNQSCDVYSYGVIMYELFFMARPYQMVKSSSSKQPRINLVALGKNVISGKRPEIPFDLDNEVDMKQWFNKTNKNPNEYNEAAIRNYLTTLQSCWSGIPDERPNFDSVYDLLSDVESLIQ
jgi:tRNA A-37 threonylcarbamoyl transferase component Bud32